MLLFITGFMGAGKSTLAKAVSLQKGESLYDTDAILEFRWKRSISSQLIDDSHRFRYKEKNLIIELSRIKRGIISLGGGAIENANTRALLRGKPVVFLDPGVDICWQRAKVDTQHRPLATDYDSFVALYKRRLPLYLSVCCWHLTDNLPPEQLLIKLERLIRQG